jgi:UDPglucose 6-dehydrogenase
LWTLRGKRLGVLGLAFKADTDDVRESPAIAVIEALVQEGAQIKVYDPAAMANAKKLLSSPAVTYVENEYEAARGSDALLILTEWTQFAALDLRRVRLLLKYPIMIDGRNLYEPAAIADAGFSYHSIGRPTVHPERPEAPPPGFATQSIGANA